MNRTLEDLLDDFARTEAAGSAATAPDPAFEARQLGRRIQRRRVIRASATSLTAAAAVVAVAVGATALTDRQEEPPPATQSPSPEPTTEPTPTSTPTPTEQPTPDEPVQTATIYPGLPTGAVPLEPGLFEASGRGWALVGYGVAETGYEGLGPSLAKATYLLDLDGRLHELPPLPVDSWVEDWLPGTSQAVLRRIADDGGSSFAYYDLASGQVGPSLELPSLQVWGRVVLTADGGSVVFTNPETDDEDVMRFASNGTLMARQALAEWHDGHWRAVLSPDRSTILVNTPRGGAALLSNDFEQLPLPAVRAAGLGGRQHTAPALRGDGRVRRRHLRHERRVGGAARRHRATPPDKRRRRT